jgi:[acyl-carrier-protein] S-malonyltransferase
MVLMCPGQGAQKVGMGRDLAERYPAARDTFGAIDEALQVPLSRLMWEGPEAELTLTHNAQPAILAHSAAVFAVVSDRLRSVGAALGHSLGEYSAYVAAGALAVPAAARLVRRRGELMLEAGQARPGTMAAVLGLGTAEVEAACAEASSGGEVAVAANLNAPDQTVISGDPGAVSRAGDGCKARGAKRVLPLKVSGAFHSPLMEPAVAGLSRGCQCDRQAGSGCRAGGHPAGGPVDRAGAMGGVCRGGEPPRAGSHLCRNGPGRRVERAGQADSAGHHLRHAWHG